MRVCVIGGGLAGSLLAWRLAGTPGISVDLVPGRYRDSDATRVSGGMVRAYEPGGAQRELAIASLAELLASPLLREWAGYQQTGFVYLPGPDEDLAAGVGEVERALPGSAAVVPAAAAFGGPQRGPDGGPPGGSAVVERQAGFISPDGLRAAVLADLAGRPGVTLLPGSAGRVEVTGNGQVRTVVDGSAREHDAAVLAGGAWTARLLSRSGLPADGYRTKSIQAGVYAAGEWRPIPFSDEVTGLYGKPVDGGGLMLGVPTTEWDVPPGLPPVTPAWHEQAARLAAARFPLLRLGPLRTEVTGADCYCDPPVLMLRPVAAAGGMYTFTGGSGGSVKTALAASSRAAAALASRAARDLPG
ncbi:MAG TPA: FAD-binding oxidoreductase [Streptosporangiaceae bacterium]